MAEKKPEGGCIGCGCLCVIGLGLLFVMWIMQKLF